MLFLITAIIKSITWTLVMFFRSRGTITFHKGLIFINKLMSFIVWAVLLLAGILFYWI